MAVSILSQMAAIMTKTWWNYDSLIHSETMLSAAINRPSFNLPLNHDQ